MRDEGRKRRVFSALIPHPSEDMTPIRIGTRGSKLALWQANFVADRLRPLAAPRPVELVIIATAETRLRKLHQGGLDATILAEAGLLRLGLGSAITEILDPTWMLPAVGQGALGLECRADDRETLALVERLNHLPTRQAVLAER